MVISSRSLWFVLPYVFALIGSGRSSITCAQCRVCPDRWNGTVTCTGETCFAQIDSRGNVDRGCYISPIIINRLCNTTDVEPDGSRIYHVCCNSSFCNANTTPAFPVDSPSNAKIPSTTTSISTTIAITSTTPAPSDFETVLVLSISLPILFLAVVSAFTIIGVAFILYITKCSCRFNKGRRVSFENEHGMFGGSVDISDGENSCTSGSGSGGAQLKPRTFAKCITLGEPIGNGRFGQVFLGTYLGDEYAVKKFASRDESSWHRETEIYTTLNVRHDNILTCFAAEIFSTPEMTELWLITQFHRSGSLFDVLNVDVLSLRTAMNYAVSITQGLSYLHNEILVSSMQGNKPSIAHRDIKSKNILVKDDGTCCIADFGLALVKDSKSPHLSMPANLKQGTKRYMAPEVLDETINVKRFSSFLRTDIYALGLVMWEIFRRCPVRDDGDVDCYEMPFQSLVRPDPSFEEMRELIVINHCTPDIPNHWDNHELLKNLALVIADCWTHNAAARPSAVLVKKRLLRASFNSGVKIGLSQTTL